MTSPAPAPRRNARSRRLVRFASAAALLGLLGLLAALTPWPGRATAAINTPLAVPSAHAQLSHYQARIQRKVVAGIDDNLSGLTYNRHTRTLFGVVNRPPVLVELSTAGDLLRKLPLQGVSDPEGIAHIDGDWFAIADERSNRVHWAQVGPQSGEVVLAHSPQQALGTPALQNFALEGLGWDRKHQQLLAVTEKWPLQVLALPGAAPPWGDAAATPVPQPWRSTEAAGLPTTDLASIEVDPRTGNLLLLGEESSVLYEYTRAGEPVGMMPLWARRSGLVDAIGQPEGVAMDEAGTLYIVAEPNLFYRFEKTWSRR